MTTERSAPDTPGEVETAGLPRSVAAVLPTLPRPGALRLPTRREVRDVARLAAPIVGVQVGIMLMGVVDAAMLGRVSPAAMAGAALGNFYWLLVTVLGTGAVQAIDPVVSQAVGARDAAAIRHGVQRGLLVAVLLTPLASLLLLPAERVLIGLRQPLDVARLAGDYVTACLPGVLPFLAFQALRQTSQAFARVRPIGVTIILANVANLFLDWVLIFGHWGFPALGVIGAAWATTVCRWLMFLVLLLVSWPELGQHLRGSWRAATRAAPIWAMLKLGLPIGVHQFLEIAAFGGALVLMGQFGTIPLAAHQITITLVALTYMVPLGLSSAAAVLVGQAIGRDDDDAARREASAALACGIGFMALSAAVLISIPGALARLFSDDQRVLELAMVLLPIGGAFQVFDGTQGVASGILRGAGDTRIPMLLNLMGFVVVGLPAAAFLAFRTSLGPAGVWWGLLVALVVVSGALGWRVHVHLGRDLRRVEAPPRRGAP